MVSKVLVAYASKYGATAEIAEKIGLVLDESGVSVDVAPVKKGMNLDPYNAVVLGSAVYIGRWRKEAVNFLKKNEKALAERDVWLFSSGPTGEGDPVELLDGWTFPGGQKELAGRIQPNDIVVFHGDVDVDKLNFIERTMAKNVDTPVGDFRDWDSITAWAADIAGQLSQENS